MVNNFNPADYKAIKDEAKEMSKTDLENYYVRDKDKKHTKCGEGIAIFLAVLVIIFVVGVVGYCIAEEHYQNNVEDSLVNTMSEICPILGEGYQSVEFYKGYGSEIDKISCNEYNSNPFGQ